MKKYISKNQIQKIERFVKTKLDDLNWLHTLKVRKWGRRLAQLEKAEPEIVDVAILFHDVAKIKAGNMRHAVVGAKIAQDFLQKFSLDEDFINQVVYCVNTHSSPWAKNAPQPQTKEAKVLFDVDMLAQMSPLGIIKNIFDYRDEPLKLCLSHAFRDIKNNAYKNLLTKNGERIGKEKFKYVKEFFSNIKNGS